MYDFFSKNGHILPASEAVVPVSNLEYAYGFGVYENIRVKNNQALFLLDHLERLFNSASIIGLKHLFIQEQVGEYVESLIARLSGEDDHSPLLEGEACLPDRQGQRVRSRILNCNLKILLIGAVQPADVQLYIIPLAPLFPDKKMYTEGVSAISVNYERPFPQAKTLNMLPSYLAYRQAKEKSCYDALLVDNAGCIREGTRTNFFVSKGKTIIGAPEPDILPGVTRKYVLELAKVNGYDISERPICLNSLKNYDSAFLTSTSGKIVPVKKIDDFILPAIPQELKRLMKLFDEFLERQ